MSSQAAAAAAAFRLQAASGPGQEYRLPIGTPIYRDLCLSRTGRWRIGDGTFWEPTAELYADFAANYDPLWHVGVLNSDHWQWDGPARGVILSCRAEGEELYGDVAVLDPWTQYEISQGLWPRWSIEWWQEELLGSKFYGKFSNYLTGLGLLGNADPAHAGLGQWPEPEFYGIEPAQDERPREGLYTLPLAAGSGETRQRALRIISTEEVPSVDDPNATGTLAPAQPTAASGNAPADPAAAQLIATLQQEVATLKAQRQADGIASRLQKLTDGGKLNAAQLPLLREALADAAQRQPLRLQAADGSTTQARPLVEVIFEILEAAAPQVSLGAQSFDVDPPVQAVALQAFDQTLAAKVGLSPEQIAKSRQQLMSSGKGGTE